MKIIQFSGGKDSLALMHMYRGQDAVTAVYVDPGDVFPHMRQFVRDTAEALGIPLHIARPSLSVKDWQDRNGLPADVVVWDATPMMAPMTKEKFPAALVPFSSCCLVNIWQPLMDAVTSFGSKDVIRGSKECDGHVGVADGYVDQDGVTYHSPLWAWSDDDVFAYLKSVGAELPPQYAAGGDSLDCWCCTAYMKHHGAARFAYLKDHYPDLYAIAKQRLEGVRQTVGAALAGLVQEV